MESPICTLLALRCVNLSSKLRYRSNPTDYESDSVMCSLSAATQGMDETATNGALPLYPDVRTSTFSAVRNIGIPNLSPRFSASTSKA